MKLIKLNAIPSTNTFLKELAVSQSIDDFTVVVAKDQFKGRGQRINTWQSELGKNLTFSMFIRNSNLYTTNPFLFSVVVPISLIEVLSVLDLRQLKIKWPNDILAENKKIAGILIETIYKSDKEIAAVIGIGLNVNQLVFDNLPNASSIAALLNYEIDKDKLLEKITNQIEANFMAIATKGESFFWDKYHQYLFRKDVPSVFKDKEGTPFQAIIRKVTNEGKMCLEYETGTQKLFDIKEITLQY